MRLPESLIHRGHPREGLRENSAEICLCAPARYPEPHQAPQRPRGDFPHLAGGFRIQRFRHAAQAFRPFALLLEIIAVIDCNHNMTGRSKTLAD